MFVDVRGVKVFSWNPRMFRGRPVVLRNSKVGRWQRVGNFGDSLGPLLARRITESKSSNANGSVRLFTVGSVLHLATKEAVVWGTGLRRPNAFPKRGVSSLDFRAVRGPITRAAIHSAGGRCPEVFGDPGLLVPLLFPEFGVRHGGVGDGGVLVIPNLNDATDYSRFGRVVNPCLPLARIVDEIRSSSFVTGTSLHAGILADAYGVPNRIAIPASETSLKYEDYYEGTGRKNQALNSVESCVESGPSAPLELELGTLLNSFPLELWD